jgi:hypothetical protein
MLYREAILAAYVFMDFDEDRYLTREWVEKCNCADLKKF